ncbi:GAF domain-containing protein, partial [candidate division WOR-3 bacterium]|nr:GAF domain-containing protein [candidate division WOR-3 bacterium]
GKTEEFESLLKKVLSLKKKVKGDNKFLPVVLSQGIQKYVKGDYKVALSYLDKIEDTIGKQNLLERQIPAMIFKSLCLLKMDKKESAQRTICKAKEIMDNSKMFLYRGEIEFIELLIEIHDGRYGKVDSKIKRILKKIREHQRFLYAQVLVAFADVQYNALTRGKRKELLSESLAYLNEAKSIFKEIEAQVLLVDVNEKLVQAYETLRNTETPIQTEKKYTGMISKFGDLIKNINDPEQLKTTFISTAKTITGAERGLFFMLDSDTNELIVTGKDIDDATIYDAKEFSKSVIKRVKKTRKPVIAYDAISEKTFESYESVRINKIRSILCIPIVTDGKVLGALYLDSRRNPRLFSKEE